MKYDTQLSRRQKALNLLDGMTSVWDLFELSAELPGNTRPEESREIENLLLVAKLWPQRADAQASCRSHHAQGHQPDCRACTRFEQRRQMVHLIRDQSKSAGHAYRSSFDRGYNACCDAILTVLIEDELAERENETVKTEDLR